MLDKFNAVYREIIAEANGRQLTVTDFISLLRNAGIEISAKAEKNFINEVWNQLDSNLRNRIAKLDYNVVAKAIKNMKAPVKENLQKGFTWIARFGFVDKAADGFKEAIPGLVAEFETVTESIVTEAEEYIIAEAQGMTVEGFIGLLRKAGIEISEEQAALFKKNVWGRISLNDKMKLARYDADKYAKAVMSLSDDEKKRIQQGFNHIDGFFKDKAISGFLEALPAAIARLAK